MALRTPLSLLILLGLTLMACLPTGEKESKDSKAPPAADAALIAEARIHFEPLSPAPQTNSSQSAQVALGKMLFFEPQLSLNKTLSCNSCHNLNTHGVDRRSTSPGHVGQLGKRNTPTVLNAHLNESQFWDGRAKNLSEQAKEPILNPLEMAMPNEAAVLTRLQNMPGYPAAFEAAFPGKQPALSYTHLSLALARFQETLITPSRFDRFLEGEAQSLTAQEKAGLKTFLNRGCVACHNGVGIGGNTFRKFGVMVPYQHQQDLGRYEVTKQIRDRYLFKVPLLRNIEHTAPYFHDGKVQTLKEAIQTMVKTQLGTAFSDQEIAGLEAFLKSLSGEVPASAKSVPVLPK